jgi:hypothetical protein
MNKLKYKEWVKKYFTDMDGWYYLNYDRIKLGFAMQDLAHYKTKDLKEEYKHYLNGTSDNPEAYNN